MSSPAVCPNCGAELICMGGCSAHPLNWYCPNVDSCGWAAWQGDVTDEEDEDDR